MSLELLYTSASAGLKQGSRGFCTVICTSGMPVNLTTRLETLSGYRHVFPPEDSRANENPIGYSHLKVGLGGRPVTILSRISAFGVDYSGRTNKLAHHVVIEPDERPPAGPAWLLRQPGFMRDSFDGNNATPPPKPSPPMSDQAPRVCQTWQSLTGDAGHGGRVADYLSKPSSRPLWIIFDLAQERQLLALIDESIALLPASLRWNATFSTYYTNLASEIDCRVRFVLRGTEEARLAAAKGDVIDLARPSAITTDSPWINAARTGIAAQNTPATTPSTDQGPGAATGLVVDDPSDPWDDPFTVASPPPVGNASAPPMPPPTVKKRFPMLTSEAPKNTAKTSYVPVLIAIVAACLLLIGGVGMLLLRLFSVSIVDSSLLDGSIGNARKSSQGPVQADAMNSVVTAPVVTEPAAIEMTVEIEDSVLTLKNKQYDQFVADFNLPELRILPEEFKAGLQVPSWVGERLVELDQLNKELKELPIEVVEIDKKLNAFILKSKEDTGLPKLSEINVAIEAADIELNKRKKEIGEFNDIIKNREKSVRKYAEDLKSLLTDWENPPDNFKTKIETEQHAKCEMASGDRVIDNEIDTRVISNYISRLRQAKSFWESRKERKTLAANRTKALDKQRQQEIDAGTLTLRVFRDEKGFGITGKNEVELPDTQAVISYAYKAPSEMHIKLEEIAPVSFSHPTTTLDIAGLKEVKIKFYSPDPGKTNVRQHLEYFYKENATNEQFPLITEVNSFPSAIFEFLRYQILISKWETPKVQENFTDETKLLAKRLEKVTHRTKSLTWNTLQKSEFEELGQKEDSLVGSSNGLNLEPPLPLRKEQLRFFCLACSEILDARDLLEKPFLLTTVQVAFSKPGESLGGTMTIKSEPDVKNIELYLRVEFEKEQQSP